ncbi:deaminase [Agromyces luteolus]|uniref:Dihydrofolate reductase n=1 Tax=Agromyces luteolus TaxID=88373 RepID=A0A7C9HIW0_9MICO|nr:dihydrofolate reductase [Agromyces luteolus]MUN08041.1 dihydrofolate reductase [Agromyces luteolus]GLK27945.1 deaminase [Agromyces luteolus]
MRQLIYYISLSIDGFIAGPDDEVDFFPGSDEYMTWMVGDYGDALPGAFREKFGIADVAPSRFDTIVMGRRTYDPALQVGVTSPYPHLRQYVVSRSLERPDPAVTVVADDVVATVRALKAEDSTLDIYLAGGGRLAGQLLDEIDGLVIKRYPVVAGAGLPAFGPDFAPTQFSLDAVRSFDGGNLVEWYSRTA